MVASKRSNKMISKELEEKLIMVLRPKGIKLIMNSTGSSEAEATYVYDRWRKKYLNDYERLPPTDAEPMVKNKYQNMEAEVRKLYCEQKMTIAQVADIIGCDKTYLHRLMKKWGIERRKKKW